jgi:preprotein translocase subunit SecF
MVITKQNIGNWYDKNYKIVLIIPIILVLICLAYIVGFYVQNGDIMHKDVSLAGGTSITLDGTIDPSVLESKLPGIIPDVGFRKLTDVATGRNIATIIESSVSPEELKSAIVSLGVNITEQNSSTEFTGPSLSSQFYKQLMIALIISFILMSFVIFFLFKSFVPSIAVIFAAFSNIVVALAILNFFEVAISAAGIAAFLTLIGYSVDTDILLTTRVLKKKEGTVNKRIFGAFKTGILMTGTALAAVLPGLLLISGLPVAFKQIFLVLAIGLSADIINTWLTNAGIIKWYCDSKNIK